MTPIEYLRGIKRRWRIIAAFAGLGIVAAGLSTLVYAVQVHPTQLATAKIAQSAPISTTANGSSSRAASTQQPRSSLSSIGTLVTQDAVTSRVAKDVGFKGTLLVLAKKVQANVDKTSGLLFVSAKGGNPATAVRFANAFASELINYVSIKDAQYNNALAVQFQQQIHRVQGDISSLDRQLARYNVHLPAPGQSGKSSTTSHASATTGTAADPLIEERNAALDTLGSLSQQYQAIRTRINDAEGLSIFQTALPAGVVKPKLPVPRSLVVRFLIGIIAGLIAGIAYSILRDRFSRSLRTRDAVEDAFGYPVLVEIAEMQGRRRTPGPSLANVPAHVADGFRLLAASLALDTQPPAAGTGADSRPAGKAVLVTSAGPAEGKTTVVTYLAAALAEVGRTVLLLSADFRHPRLHRQFGASNEKGLADALRQSDGGPVLNGCVWYTSLNGVWLLPSGKLLESPDQLLSSSAMRQAISEARDRADVVLIDTSPVLTSDATFLWPFVDSVLIVSKARKTKPELAERSSEQLQRLGAPVAGVVLIADTATALPRAYYRTAAPLRPDQSRESANYRSDGGSSQPRPTASRRVLRVVGLPRTHRRSTISPPSAAKPTE